MSHWLAPEGAAKEIGHVKRFDARFWTVDFPRPMMAGCVTTGSHSLRVDAVFYRKDDLAGLIWEAEDRWDHPLVAYATDRDFRGCRLSFRWRSGGVKALDDVHGPTLTIEGRDEAGQARAWYVRLWNHASGSPEDATIALDFDAMEGGWEGGDPVWAGDVDRMFISLVAPDYDASDDALAAPAEGWCELSELLCEGAGSTIAIGETLVPEHGLRIATGYDDLYNVTPARMLRNILFLGYRGIINHYVGMSHYFRLGTDLIATGAGGALNAPCAAWHADFLGRAKALDYKVILSLSYELLDQHCPEGWKQRAEDGTPALTGWEPPSALLSPANASAMAYLQGVGAAFAGLAVAANQPVRFQVGEPWWWVRASGEICIYDDAAVAAFAPVSIADVRGTLTQAQKDTLDAAGAVLAQSTADLVGAVKAVAADAETLLLVYLPTVLDPSTGSGQAGGEVKRANVPLGWASPAFDLLQLEDYEWVTEEKAGATERGIAEATARLGYPVEEQHYFAGFVLNAEDAHQWRAIGDAAQAGFSRGSSEVFVWALPQAIRDGFTWFSIGDDEVEAFADERFPVAIGREASVEPGFSTAVVTTASGAEQRNADWADARMRYDAGPGVRGEAELHELIAFFRARRGAAQAFRFEDPFDNSSNGMTGDPGAADQIIGSGDGGRTDFELVKHYGGQQRRITRPVAGSVRVSLDGVEQASGWSLAGKGVVSFDAAPPAGAEVRAGFRFDVAVRFAEDRLEINRATFMAGEAVSVPLIEVRE
ncbi:MAG: DUF2460 domain-containing protein [Sphingomonadaceae bacterium]